MTTNSPASSSSNPGPATVTGNDYLGGGDASGGVQMGNTSASTLSFYGVTPVAQRATTSIQLTSNLATTTTTPTSAQFNAAIGSLQEVMNTLKAYGLWGTA